jgi:hypothetical protein
MFLTQPVGIPVFAPDTTLSGVKVLNKVKNNFYVLRAVERDSANSWKEYTFAYDAPAGQYNVTKTQCYRYQASEDKAISMKCD